MSVNRVPYDSLNTQHDLTSSGDFYFDAATDTIVFGSGGGNANSAILVNSTTKGIRLPLMNTTERNAITASEGLVVFDETLQAPCIYTTSGWEILVSAVEATHTISYGGIWSTPLDAIVISTRDGDIVNLYGEGLTGTADTPGAIESTTALPVDLRPAEDVYGYLGLCEDNGFEYTGSVVIQTNGLILITLLDTGLNPTRIGPFGNFTGTGTSGFWPFNVTYNLDHTRAVYP